MYLSLKGRLALDVEIMAAVEVNLKWHALETSEVLDNLQTTKGGLSAKEAELRLQKFGFNELMGKKGVSVLQVFLGQFKDVFVVMLLAAILISVVVGEIVDASVILIIVALNAAVGFIQEYRSEKAMEAMKKMTAPKARLLRDGKEVTVPAREVVPGDIVLLESGDRVPADGRLVEAIDLKTSEAVLTGESTPVEKKTGALKPETRMVDLRNMVFTATHIIYGRGKGVVTATGMGTEFGKIAEMVQSVKAEEPPLKLKLKRFAKKLGMIIVIACIAIFVLEAFREQNFVDTFLIAIALAVSAVPEGLPAIVTVTLALGARELTKRNAVIRKLSSAETLGSTTIICSDKTGTLTKGEMTVRKIYSDGKITEVTGVGYEAKGEFRGSPTSVNPEEDAHLNLLLRIGALCNNAGYDGEKITGDPTEGALIVTAAKAGMWKGKLEEEYPRVGEIPFSSERKLMTTVHRAQGKRVAYVKGAPETVLGLCTKVYRNGQVKTLGRKEKEELLKINNKLASEALRLLGMAYRGLPDGLDEFSEENVERDLVFVGLMGMIDPPRDEVKEANRLCEQAGIKTVMITGDHKLTAVAVAKEIGMLKGGLVLTGGELDKIGDEEFEKMVEDVVVYARVYPEQKLRIVRALKKKGHIVAMTGDGVNDAPALKNADIGVAMGITGTDVSKEASDMVLMDDNFATIVNAVKQGRIIYDNIRKFAFFLIRSNFDELVVITSFALAGLPLPISAAMILWINLVTDGGPAIALSMDTPTEDVMQRPPRDPKQGILYGRVASILASLIMQSVGTAFVFLLSFYMLWPGLLPKAMSMAFMQAITRELIIVWNCRSERHNAFRVGFTSNKFLLVAVVASFFLTVSLCYVPFFQVAFGTAALNITDWIIVSLVACSGFLILPEVFYERKVLRWV